MRSDGLQRIGALAIALVAGCGSGANADGDSETTGGPATSLDATGVEASTGADGQCVPGWEGCPCFEDERCISGLMCLSNHCVLVPDASSSEGDTAHEATTDTTESSGDTTDASSSEESSSTGVPDVCYADDTYCDDDELQSCVDGQWEVVGCEDACALIGYASLGCDQRDSCLCSGHIDTTCDNAAYNHCVCIEALYGEITCTTDQMEMEYQACAVDETPSNTCWSTSDINTVEDCQLAVMECGA